MPAGVAGAALLQRAGVVAVAGVAQAQHAGVGEQIGVAGVAGRHHAVEHVHAPAHGLHDVLRCADAHQVARLARRQARADEIEHAQHVLARLAHRQAADGIAVEADVLQAGQRRGAQVLVNPALHDAEQGRRMLAVGGPAARRPAQGQLHRTLRRGVIGRVRRAFVEDHHHVAAQAVLDGNGLFRPQEHAAAVHGRAKPHALLADLAKRLEAIDLKAAGVGQDRSRPGHEPVQTAVPAHDVHARAQHQMKGVAQQYLRAGVGHFLRRQGFDRALRADRHEGRRVHHTAREIEPAAAGRTVAGQ